MLGDVYHLPMSFIRIPPSLNWLIQKYSRLTGRLEYLEETVPLKTKELQNLSSELVQVREDLKALEKVIDLHGIKVDVQEIEPQKTNRNVTQQKYGQLTKIIYAILKDHHQSSTPEIFEELTTRLNIEFEDPKERILYGCQ